MRTEAESGKVRIDKERFFNLPVVILIASSFMLGMSEFIVVGILPDIAADLKISEVTVGNLVSLFAFVYAPVTPLGSALSARFPRFATHLTLIGIFLAGNILCAFAPNYAVLVVARIMIALVSGTLVAVAMTYAPDVTTDRFRTKFIAWVFSGFSIASVVGVPVGTWVANTFGWRWAFHMINVLTIMLIVGMVVALPRNSHIVKIGFLPQFRLFFDRRIQLGVLDVVCGAAASYVFYTYLTPIMRDEVHVPEQYLSVGLVIFGAACLWSNLYGGKLADRGRGVEPLTHIRPIYCAHAVLMASLVVAHWVPVYGALLLVVLGMFMYLQITCSVFQLPHDSAVFPVFPTVPAWFAYHSNSLQITSFLYKTWAKCGHGITRPSAVRGIGAPTVPRHDSPRRRQAAISIRRVFRSSHVPAA
ncbi:MFS transporter [Bifidobacterium adolescentis]|uniref:MFS transporter n=1 Tax=Bifidobacterium adolescentis TaxID=1680 RepID=UPI00398D197F